MDWVWTHSTAKGTARLVLLAIADKANGAQCSAYAGTTMLVRRSKAARSSVIVAVDKLLESGELRIIEGRKGPGGETVYTLPLARKHRRTPDEGGPKSGPVQNPDPSENRTPRGTESGPPRSENRTPTGPKTGPHNPRNAEKPKGTHTPAPPADHDDPADAGQGNVTRLFNEWWDQYGRGTAQAKRTVRQAIADAITNGIDPNVLRPALARLGNLAKPVTGGTLQFALSETRQHTPSGEVVPFRGPAAQHRPSTTDARVQAALDLGRQMQAEADAAAAKEAQ